MIRLLPRGLVPQERRDRILARGGVPGKGPRDPGRADPWSVTPSARWASTGWRSGRRRTTGGAVPSPSGWAFVPKGSSARLRGSAMTSSTSPSMGCSIATGERQRGRGPHHERGGGALSALVRLREGRARGRPAGARGGVGGSARGGPNTRSRWDGSSTSRPREGCGCSAWASPRPARRASRSCFRRRPISIRPGRRSSVCTRRGRTTSAASTAPSSLACSAIEPRRETSTRTAVEDLLIQLHGHSSYHRGQIASAMRAMGAEPAATDYVFWARRRVEEGEE